MICLERRVEVLAPYSDFLVSEEELLGEGPAVVVAPAIRNPQVQISQDTELISIREAAKRLHVHENTVRRLIDQGLVEFVRLPGSGYRRLAQADVERLRGGMRLSYGRELDVARQVDKVQPRKYAGGVVPVSREELARREGLA